MLEFSFIGNVAADARVYPNNGRPFISFRVAVSRKYKTPDGQPVEKTTWIDCTRNGDDKFGQYVKKGVKVWCRGEVSARAYTAHDGQPAASLQCHVRDMELLGGGERKAADEAPF